MPHLKRTKIIATLGPSVTGYIFTEKDYKDPKNKEALLKAKENLKKLIEAGVDAFRFNFSHGNYEEQSIRLKLIKEVLEENNLVISLILDTKGPEIRIGKFEKDSASIKIGDKINIHTNDQKLKCTKSDISVYASSENYFMENDIKIDSKIFVDDGKLVLTVKDIIHDKHLIKTVAENAHVLKSNKRINLPDSDYSLKFMSKKDAADVKFAVDNKFDYIAASFVNSVKNVAEIRQEIDKYGPSNIQIISKIETKTAIKNIDDIICVSDGIMVARGDLGLEIPYHEIPYWEKYIIKACRFYGRPCIVATQMLDSLEVKMQPTRAEVTDVFFAVDRGADATMLSGETANGVNPINAVEVMSKINITSEQIFDYERAHSVYFKKTPFSKKSFGKVVEDVAKEICPKKSIKNSDFTHDAVFYFGNNCEKMRALSNIHLAAMIFVITDIADFKTFFGIHYGIKILLQDDLVKSINDYEHIVKNISEKYDFKNESIIIFDEELKNIRKDI
ncbi:MAG: pyruvate kinase [Mycoplasmoidaceae bacterium]